MAETIFRGASSDDAEVICIVIHGRGQTQADMMASIVDRLSLPKVRFVLPKSDDVGWYAARAIDPLTDETSRELEAAIDAVSEVIAQARAETPDRPLLLCGFSQGACLAVELLMRQPEIADAACLLTACRVGAASDKLPQARLTDLPVYASCGDEDPWIPENAYHHMLGDLTRAGARIRSDLFPGRPHEVTDTEIAVISDMLANLAQKRPLLGAAV
ncbi:dienelactone hydrolase family protein [Sulfitobacter sp. HNIBRBA3233]|uniref:alpha/beta hydrolase n=1 Tax=Sulfitobacter marinivivus TaxID=3158558 RepID=UPI0032DE5B4A